MDLVEFLLARLDEDEALARPLMTAYAWGYSTFWEGSKEEIAHIERHSPARVLADIAAKRAIVGMYEAARGGNDEPLLAGVLRALAAPY